MDPLGNKVLFVLIFWAGNPGIWGCLWIVHLRTNILLVPSLTGAVHPMNISHENDFMQAFFGKNIWVWRFRRPRKSHGEVIYLLRSEIIKPLCILRPLQFKNTPNKAIEYPHVHEEIHLQVIPLFSLLSSFAAVVFRYYTTTPAAKKNWEFWMNFGFRSCNGWIFLKSRFQEKQKQLLREQTNSFKIDQFIYFHVFYWNWMIIWNSSALGWNLPLRQKNNFVVSMWATFTNFENSMSIGSWGGGCLTYFAIRN